MDNLTINKKCEQCGRVHEYRELFRSENHQLYHFTASICPYCHHINEFTMIFNEKGIMVHNGKVGYLENKCKTRRNMVKGGH